MSSSTSTWCDRCSGYHESSDGRCSNCGAEVELASAEPEPDHVGASAPWHFWVVVALLAAYLLWRLVEGIIWVAN